MSPQLRTDEDHRIKGIDDVVAGDSRRILFTVLQDGTPRDISNDDITWRLSRRPYQRTDTELDGTSTGVEVVTNVRADTANAEFELRIDEDVTTELWGKYWQTIVIDPEDKSRQSWLGKIEIESA